MRAAYVAAVQLIDRNGDLSPVSGRSSPVTIDTETIPLGRYGATPPEDDLHCILWRVPTGPTGTVGRILLHTKNMELVGDTKLYMVPPNVVAALPGAYATMPDNLSGQIHYNRPDAHLFLEAVDPAPVPSATIGVVAMDRLWLGGIKDDPGRIIGSYPGRWGTFDRLTERYPDPTGAKVTALAAIDGGMLVFTAKSTYVMLPSNTGEGFVSRTVSSRIGCVAPDTVRASRFGMIWLGADGFYVWDGQTIVPAPWFGDVAGLVATISKPRMCQATAQVDPASGEYRCWVPIGSEDNSVCVVLCSQGWRRRTDIIAGATCVAGGVIVAAGTMSCKINGGSLVARESIWVIDREAPNVAVPKVYIWETGWVTAPLAATRGMRGAILVAYESARDTILATVYRDGRTVKVGEVRIKMYEDGASALFYGISKYGAAGVWEDPVQVLSRGDLSVSSVRSYRLRLTTNRRCRLLAVVPLDIVTPGTSRV